MKVKKLFIVPILILFYLSSTLYAGDEGETIEGFPEYTDVDVVIDCDWGQNDKIENTKVFDHSDAKEPYLRILKSDGVSSLLTLIKGIKVNILDHKNHELLKTYIGKYVKQ